MMSCVTVYCVVEGFVLTEKIIIIIIMVSGMIFRLSWDYYFERFLINELSRRIGRKPT